MSDPRKSHERVLLRDIAHPTDGAFVDGPFGSNLKSDEYVEQGVRLIQLQNIGDGYWKDGNKKYITDLKFRALARHGAVPGDIAIAKMADPVARACIVPDYQEQYVVVADCIRLRVDESRFDPRYIVRAINSHETRAEAERKSIGSTRIRINLGTLKSVGCLVPPLQKQQAIADILDTLDTAIRQTEAIIAKLKQVKQGLLHDLLTRGIDANGELRPPQSQAPHLYKQSLVGWIPKQWEAPSVHAISPKPSLGLMVRGASEGGVNMGLLKMGNLRWGNELDLHFVEQLGADRAPDIQAFVLGDGDVLFNTRNTPELVGKTCSWRTRDGDYVYDNNILRLRLNPAMVNGHYVAAYMGSHIGQRRIFSMATGTTSVAAIYWKDLRNFVIPLPQISEQQQIVAAVQAHYEREHGELRTQRQLSLMKVGLMDDLLTGRVRVTPLLETATTP